IRPKVRTAHLWKHAGFVDRFSKDAQPRTLHTFEHLRCGPASTLYAALNGPSLAVEFVLGSSQLIDLHSSVECRVGGVDQRKLLRGQESKRVGNVENA